MRHPLPTLAAVVMLLSACGSEPKAPAPEAAQPAAAARPADETRRFPMADRLSTEVVPNHLLDKPFMPGGTLAHYKKGKTAYLMFVAKTATAQDAAFVLLDWHKALANSTIIPSFGGYFGDDGGRPVFVFAKDKWVAGVAGLAQKDADLAARGLAAHLN